MRLTGKRVGNDRAVALPLQSLCMALSLIAAPLRRKHRKTVELLQAASGACPR